MQSYKTTTLFIEKELIFWKIVFILSVFLFIFRLFYKLYLLIYLFINFINKTLIVFPFVKTSN